MGYQTGRTTKEKGGSSMPEVTGSKGHIDRRAFIVFLILILLLLGDFWY